MTTILGYVTAISGAIFDVGQDLIDFVTASGNEICLLGVGLFVTVAAIGAIRRLITGV